jgi:hypothetical protein
MSLTDKSSNSLPSIAISPVRQKKSGRQEQLERRRKARVMASLLDGVEWSRQEGGWTLKQRGSRKEVHTTFDTGIDIKNKTPNSLAIGSFLEANDSLLQQQLDKEDEIKRSKRRLCQRLLKKYEKGRKELEFSITKEAKEIQRKERDNNERRTARIAQIEGRLKSIQKERQPLVPELGVTDNSTVHPGFYYTH